MASDFAGTKELFELGGWRDSRSAKRELAVNLVKGSGGNSREFEQLVEQVKRQSAWHSLGESERNRLQVFFYSVRQIVAAWDRLPPRIRAEFLDGDYVYSTLVSRLKNGEIDLMV